MPLLSPLVKMDATSAAFMVFVFVVVLIVMIIYYISQSDYLNTVISPWITFSLLLGFGLCKAILLPMYSLAYPILLLLGLFVGGWFVNQSLIKTARYGASFLAFVLLTDSIYTGYLYRYDTKQASSVQADNSVKKYATYGSILMGVGLALTLGYAAL